MSVIDNVLELFEKNKGIYFSGEAVARQLNVTRSAVWKAIKTLKSRGYEINAVTNRGYCMSVNTDILSAGGIKKYIDNSEKYDIHVFDSVTSTNTLLKEMAANGAKQCSIVIANEQTEGRGRFKRKFFSPYGSGIYLSILLRPDMSAQRATFITTAAAVAMSRTIDALVDEKAQIKWVNDIYINNKKVCGILTEAAFDMESGKISYAVLGVGINAYKPEGGFDSEIKNIAGAVFDRQINDGKNLIASGFINNFMKIYNNLDDNDFLEEYKSRSMILGKKINVIKNNQAVNATAVDIDDNCYLIVKYDSGETEKLSAGEVSIKLK